MLPTASQQPTAGAVAVLLRVEFPRLPHSFPKPYTKERTRNPITMAATADFSTSVGLRATARWSAQPPLGRQTAFAAWPAQ
jgi:hypothetical protein